MSQMIEGILIGLTLIGVAIILTLAVSPMVDTLVPYVVEQNALLDIPEEYNTLNSVMWVPTLIYLLLRLLGIVGVIIIMISVTKRMRYDREEEERVEIWKQ